MHDTEIDLLHNLFFPNSKLFFPNSKYIFKGTSLKTRNPILTQTETKVTITLDVSKETAKKTSAEILDENQMPSSLNIFLSHCPPYGVLDSCDNGALIGSKGLLKLIEATKPDIVICGHVHEHGGEIAKIGNTYVVNVATVYKVLEISEDGSCRLI